jgi:hypothetical protein
MPPYYAPRSRICAAEWSSLFTDVRSCV